ncbi:hypothetical protein KVT40_001431 [Elsinoe batatas]|uniref:Origin recognition complex subunit 2 n=1 Tax=Elsinoe batatas TaxID=2601811 RepID=A0A8K0L5Y5_9PEZI|nr:hypothetical protein KVT40_001431 [Elsinoe batatas]
MARKRASEAAPEGEKTPKKTKSAVLAAQEVDSTTNSPAQTPSKLRSILKVTENGLHEETPRSVRKVLFSQPATPYEQDDPTSHESPLAKARRLDSSARRKSNRRLLEQSNGDEDGGIEDEEALAEQILAAQDEEDISQLEDGTTSAPDTPSKTPRPRGRPKGRRKERTPTPDFNLPPHELFFFQNRAGGAKTSTNTLPSTALLNHETYFAKIAEYTDPHARDIAQLSRHHHRAFDQWTFELSQGFSLCLYGYGSKRSLLTSFANHLHNSHPTPPTIIVINAYNPALTIKSLLTTLSSVLAPNLKLPSAPAAAIDALLAHLSISPPSQPYYLIIHSLDAPPLRKHISLITSLSTSPSISLITSFDTPTFPLLLPLPLLSQLRPLYHDATTFAPYTAELPVVDEVNALLSRSGRRVGGKDGVVFVLRSLPENARGLFRILVSEQLTAMEGAGVEEYASRDDDGEGGIGGEEEGFSDAEEEETGRRTKVRGKGRPEKKAKKGKGAQVGQEKGVAREERTEGVEYRLLYHKAVEEFVCSSEMGFRTLLKEFYDHQIVESRKDGMGTERLVVPFGRGELEGMLEELI